MQGTNIRTTTSSRYPSMRSVSSDMQPGREQANYFPLWKQWWQMIPEKNFKPWSRKRGHYLSKGDHLRKTDNRKSHKQLAQMVSLTEDRGSEGKTLSCRDFQATCRQESESALSSDSTVMPLMGLQMRWCDWFAAEKGHGGSNQEAEGLK